MPPILLTGISLLKHSSSCDYKQERGINTHRMGNYMSHANANYHFIGGDCSNNRLSSHPHYLSSMPAFPSEYAPTSFTFSIFLAGVHQTESAECEKTTMAIKVNYAIQKLRHKTFSPLCMQYTVHGKKPRAAPLLELLYRALSSVLHYFKLLTSLLCIR